MTAAGTPYVSIVVTGRNDNFGGDFNGRFFRALRFNHEQLTLAGIPYEVVLVEWRPVPAKPHLASLLEAEFSDLGPSRLRCYVVDPIYHDALSLNPRLQFHEFIAKNVGIRRARGQFVLTTNTDIYLSRGVLRCLALRSLQKGVLYRAARCDLKSYSDMSRVDWDQLEDERNYDIMNVIRPPLFTNASGDFLLLDRDSYHDLGGFNEVYRLAKIHIDGNFCVKAYESGVPPVDIGWPVYHVGRGTFHAQSSLYWDRPEMAPWGDRRWKSNVTYVNRPEWGLGGAPERQVNACTTLIEFAWDQVGPIVDLSRVVRAGSSPRAPRAPATQ
jgi:hypothetical protein